MNTVPFTPRANADAPLVAVDGVPPDALPDLEEVESLFDQFAPCFVESGAGLSRRFSRVIAVHRGA